MEYLNLPPEYPLPEDIKKFSEKMRKLNRIVIVESSEDGEEWSTKWIFTKGYIGPLPKELRP